MDCGGKLWLYDVFLLNIEIDVDINVELVIGRHEVEYGIEHDEVIEMNGDFDEDAELYINGKLFDECIWG